jgi:monoamine oxidase
MQRRIVIPTLGSGLAGSVLLPQIGACKKNSNWEGTVAIIGGGAAGMATANRLQQMGIDYQILEAHAELGGRVKKLSGFTDGDVELGAEFVHGKNSDFYRLVKDAGADFVKEDDMEVGLFWLDGQLKTESVVALDPDVAIIQDFEDAVSAFTGGDITLEEYADSKAALYPARTRTLLNGIVANPLGSTLDKIGMASLKSENNEWTTGDTDYLIPNLSFIDAFKDVYSGALENENVQLNWPVKSIDYAKKKISITNEAGETLEFDKVVVTVPLAVLQKNTIDFSPSLSVGRTSAISQIGMDAGMKIILNFNSQFWDPMFGIIGGESIVEYWVPLGTTNTLTAFVMGRRAQELSELGSKAIDEAVAQLDTFYGAGVASGAFNKGHIQDWTRDPYIGGAYSYASPGSFGLRGVIADSIDDKIYFAGEATHTEGHNSTVHGAMETGERAANEIFDAVS